MAVIAGAFFAGGKFAGPLYRIPSLAELASHNGSVLLHDRPILVSSQNRAEFRELGSILQTADWTNEEYLLKGSHKVEFEGSRTIYYSYYGHFFTVNGVPGSFVLSKDRGTRATEILESMGKTLGEK